MKNKSLQNLSESCVIYVQSVFDHDINIVFFILHSIIFYYNSVISRMLWIFVNFHVYSFSQQYHKCLFLAMAPKKPDHPEVKPLIGRVGTNLKIGIVGVPNGESFNQQLHWNSLIFHSLI